jgi:hypothetical protein
MNSKRIKLFILFAFPFVLFFCGSETVINSKDDIQYIQAFVKEWRLNTNIDAVHQSFDNEIQFIHTLQDSVVLNVKSEEIALNRFGDVPYYYETRRGLCYDRAVLMEKILSHYGFSFRHIYAYFGEKGEMPSKLSIFNKGLSSHALFEVKTKKGWMAVGTNSDWIALSADNNVLTVKDLRDKVREGTLSLKYGEPSLQPFWKVSGVNFHVVYGLYSRHGKFFVNQNMEASSFISNFSFFPDYNIRMLFYNFFD